MCIKQRIRAENSVKLTAVTRLSYRSTRGQAPARAFDDLLLAGLAPDGGLYMPSEWPRLSAAALAGPAALSFAETVAEVMRLFAPGSVLADRFLPLAERAYADFPRPEAAPLVSLGDNRWFLELFHGPSFAFKDFAMQYLGQLIPALLEHRGEAVTILAATSGDTGSAAIAAFAGRPATRVVVLHPEGRVSDIQRKQMTAARAANVVNFAVDGDFDDCQALVKSAFGDRELVKRHGLVAVNSINWARIVAQSAYYVAAALRLGGRDGRGVKFVVPSGNFGNAYAARVARNIGAPVASAGVATNRNDILARFFGGGAMERRAVVATIAPSMDIQVASNFERLLFEILDGDAARLRDILAEFAGSGRFTVASEVLERAREFFWGAAVSEAEIEAEIRHWHESRGLLPDPHSAVGLAAMRRRFGDGDGDGDGGAVVALGCAHPAKFADTVERAAGVAPVMPAALAELSGRTERVSRLAGNFDDLRRALDALPVSSSSTPPLESVA